MPDPVILGQTALKGWRKAAADRLAPAVAQRGPLSEEQARAAVGALFFALSTFYVVTTAKEMVQAARG